MSIQPIPTFDAPFYSEAVTLEGVSYRLSFAYSQRENTWYLSLADSANVDIYNGIKLTCLAPLLRKCADPRRPPGELAVFSSTADLSPPGLEDLVAGTGRCSLIYVTSDWLALLVPQPPNAAAAAAGLAQVQAILAANTQSGTQSTYGQQ